MDNIHYLYKIVNLVNSKIYIGVTKNPIARKQQHLYHKTYKNTSLIKRAVKKYGPDNFRFEVICIGSLEYIYELEAKAISTYNSVEVGYNIRPGGLGGLGHKVFKRADDQPVFVAGFWFPNKRSSILSLNMSLNVYEKRRKDGTLGIYPYTVPRKSNSTALKVPNYYKGFWFPDLIIAGKVFNKRPESIRHQILRGVFEEDRNIKKEKPQRKYLADGQQFDTLLEASKVLCLPLTTIKNRISSKAFNYGYIYST